MLSMDTPFIYNKFVSGKHFIGRRSESAALGNLLSKGENAVIYEPSKTGKMSLIQQTFYNMRVAGARFEVAEFCLLGIRSREAFICGLGDTVLRLFFTTPGEYASASAKYLAGTHLIFDAQKFSAEDKVLSLSDEPDENDLLAVISLAGKIASDNASRCYILLSEFQDLMLFPGGDKICRTLDSALRDFGTGQKQACSYIFTGSQVNAMKEIFENWGRFRKSVEHISLSPIDTKEIIDYVVKGFLVSGKVIERDLLLGVCRLFRQNIWYINHFSAICDSLSKGYIMQPLLAEALEMLISIHEPRFISIMEGLTTFQTSLLRAILEEETKFSSSETIIKYGLNSSANVRRIKDALCKKEIIVFDSEDRPSVIDPLFEFWAKKYYFKITR